MGEAADQVKTANDLNEMDDLTVKNLSQVPAGHPVAAESEGGAEAAQLRSDIEQTRGSLSQTIDALQEKLDPSRIAEQVKDQIREKAGEAFDTAKNTVREATIGKAEKIMANVSETVSDVTGRAGAAVKDTGSSIRQYASENPFPLVLIGVGVGILAFNMRRKSQPSYRDYPAPRGSSSLTDKARETTGRATAALSSAADSVRDTANSAVDATRQQLSYVTDQARHGAEVATDRFQTTLEESPLALGVAALAAGAILGLSLPSTQIEGEYMGKARDQVVDRAKSVAQETAQKVQRVTEEAGRTLKDAAQKEGLAT